MQDLKKLTYEIIGAAQMLNYLRIAQLKIGLVINFRNSKIEVKRLSK
ncbi:MAG: hypothetical protein KDN22_28305 [Verrucomicrobiae bacterium]|nr:hypothetical protein [Verrucomicrobiae bacterium]